MNSRVLGTGIIAVSPPSAPALRLLAVETSTELCSAALLRGDELFVEEALAPNQHAERLAPMVRRLLARAGLAAGDLDAFAFGQGPGSFTGLRIACGMAQGLAFGAARPVVPVPSLLALAEQANASRVVVGLDARMGETYLAAYSRMGGDWQAAIEPGLVLRDGLPAASRPRLGGHGQRVRRLRLASRQPTRRAWPPASRATCRGRVRWPGSRRASSPAARRCAAEEAAPLYLRDKVALTTRERQAAG